MREMEIGDSGGRRENEGHDFTDRGDRSDRMADRGDRDREGAGQTEHSRDPDLKQTIEIDSGRELVQSKDLSGAATGNRRDGSLETQATGNGGDYSLLHDRASGSSYKLLDRGESLLDNADGTQEAKEKFLEIDFKFGVVDLVDSPDLQHLKYNEMRIHGNWQDGYTAEGDLVRAAAMFFGAYKDAKDYGDYGKALENSLTAMDIVKFAAGKLIESTPTSPDADKVDHDFVKSENDRNFSRGLVDWGDRTERMIWGDRSYLPDLRSPGRSFK
jgi:hypothetical protein